MNKTFKFIILAIVFVLVIVGCVIGYNNLIEKYSPENNVPAPVVTSPANTDPPDTQDEEENIVYAPDFTVLNMAGEEVSLSDFIGKAVVLNFWATWCGPCKSEMPHFETLYQEYGEQVEFMMVNLTDGVQDTAEDVVAFIEDTGYTFPVYLDTELSGAATYGVYSIPMSVFINAEGEIIYYQLGMMSEENLRYVIEFMIGG